MKLTLTSNPATALAGKANVPGDKSITHRALILAAITARITVIRGAAIGKDCLATLECLRSLGVTIARHGTEITVYGVGKYGLKPSKMALDCGNSGTTMRLLCGLLAGQNFTTTLIGDMSLSRRPMARVIEPLTAMGAVITSQNGMAPLVIHGQRKLRGLDFTMPVASAQVKSALLLAGLYAEGVSIIRALLPMRDHTERLLGAFATDFCIPGDISSAAFLIVAATIVPSSEIVLENIGMNPTRNAIVTILQAMGADIRIEMQQDDGNEHNEPVATIHVRHASLVGIEISQELATIAIDEIPIIVIAAAVATGQTIIRHVAELRVKESDRITALCAGLRATGIKVTELADGLVINGGKFDGGIVNSYGDHRIAMAFLVAGAVALAPIIVTNCDNIATSFPDFVEIMNSINMNIAAGRD